MPIPRMRQLRRDKVIFPMAMNVVRLHLEEDERLAREPHLREAPDAELVRIRQVADSWIGLVAGYIIQKHRCSTGQALEMLGELLNDLRRAIPADEVRHVPLSAVMNLPPGLLPDEAPLGAS